MMFTVGIDPGVGDRTVIAVLDGDKVVYAGDLADAPDWIRDKIVMASYDPADGEKALQDFKDWMAGGEQEDDDDQRRYSQKRCLYCQVVIDIPGFYCSRECEMDNRAQFDADDNAGEEPLEEE